MSTAERQKMILRKIKSKGIKVGSIIPNKKYENKEI